MHIVILANEVLARRTPTTPQGWLGVAIVLAMIGAVFVGSTLMMRARLTRQSNAEWEQLSAGSASFCARWPRNRLQYAPHGELEAELERCWRMVLILEQQVAGSVGDSDGRIAALRNWITTILAALNRSAAPER